MSRAPDCVCGPIQHMIGDGNHDTRCPQYGKGTRTRVVLHTKLGNLIDDYLPIENKEAQVLLFRGWNEPVRVFKLTALATNSEPTHFLETEADILGNNGLQGK